MRHGDGGAEISSRARIDRALWTDNFLHERRFVDEVKVAGAARDTPGWVVARDGAARRCGKEFGKV